MGDIDTIRNRIRDLAGSQNDDACETAIHTIIDNAKPLAVFMNELRSKKISGDFFRPVHDFVHGVRGSIRTHAALKSPDDVRTEVDLRARAVSLLYGAMRSILQEESVKASGIDEPVVTDKIIAFPETPGLKWGDISIMLESNDSVKIQTPRTFLTVTYIDLGFRDNRKGDLPTKAWYFLIKLAEENGEITYSSQSFDPKNKSRVKELRKILRKYFRITEDPFYSYKKCGGYKAIFRINGKS